MVQRAGYPSWRLSSTHHRNLTRLHVICFVADYRTLFVLSKIALTSAASFMHGYGEANGLLWPFLLPLSPRDPNESRSIAVGSHPLLMPLLHCVVLSMALDSSL